MNRYYGASLYTGFPDCPTDEKPQKLFPLLLFIHCCGFFLFLALLDDLRLRSYRFHDLYSWRCHFFSLCYDIHDHFVRIGQYLDAFLELQVAYVDRLADFEF